MVADLKLGKEERLLLRSTRTEVRGRPPLPCHRSTGTLSGTHPGSLDAADRGQIHGFGQPCHVLLSVLLSFLGAQLGLWVARVKTHIYPFGKID